MQNTLTSLAHYGTISSTMTRHEERVTMKLDPELHRRLKVLASLHGKTMKQFLEEYVNTQWEKLPREEKLPKTK